MFKAFHSNSIFDKGEIGMEGKSKLVNDAPSSWYNRVGHYLLLSFWGKGQEMLHGNESA